jgi:hypothetical protein
MSSAIGAHRDALLHGGHLPAPLSAGKFSCSFCGCTSRPRPQGLRSGSGLHLANPFVPTDACTALLQLAASAAAAVLVLARL